MVVIPRYEPVFVEPNMKEYETQVLQMSMAVDDHDSSDLKLGTSVPGVMSSIQLSISIVLAI